MIRAPLLLACMSLLAACSSKTADPAAAPAAVVPQPTVIDPQLKALQDAKARRLIGAWQPMQLDG